MLTAEDIKLMTEMMSNLMDEKLKPINERLDAVEGRLDKIDERLEIIEEDVEVTRYGTNELIRWVDTNFRHKYPFPIDKDEAI